MDGGLHNGRQVRPVWLLIVEFGLAGICHQCDVGGCVRLWWQIPADTVLAKLAKSGVVASLELHQQFDWPICQQVGKMYCVRHVVQSLVE